MRYELCRSISGRNEAIRKSGFVFYSKEGFSSSCEMGIAGAGVLLVFAYIMSRGRINYEFGEAAVRFLYFLVVIAIPEEFIFRGYIGKRFYGAIPNRFAAVAATAVLFAFEHIPFHAAVRGMSLTEYFAMNWKTLIPLGGKGKDEKTTVIKKRG